LLGLGQLQRGAQRPQEQRRPEAAAEVAIHFAGGTQGTVDGGGALGFGQLNHPAIGQVQRRPVDEETGVSGREGASLLAGEERPLREQDVLAGGIPDIPGELTADEAGYVGVDGVGEDDRQEAAAPEVEPAGLGADFQLRRFALGAEALALL
jgi:hypothetical protein